MRNLKMKSNDKTTESKKNFVFVFAISLLIFLTLLSHQGISTTLSQFEDGTTEGSVTFTTYENKTVNLSISIFANVSSATLNLSGAENVSSYGISNLDDFESGLNGWVNSSYATLSSNSSCIGSSCVYGSFPQYPDTDTVINKSISLGGSNVTKICYYINALSTTGTGCSKRELDISLNGTVVDTISLPISSFQNYTSCVDVRSYNGTYTMSFERDYACFSYPATYVHIDNITFYNSTYSYPVNASLEIGNTDGGTEWSYIGEFNHSNNKTVDFSTELNDAINNESCDCTGCTLDGTNCIIPFIFHSDNGSTINYSALNIEYTGNDNPTINRTYLSSSSNSTNASIKLYCDAQDNQSAKLYYYFNWYLDGELNKSYIRTQSTTDKFNFSTGQDENDLSSGDFYDIGFYFDILVGGGEDTWVTSVNASGIYNAGSTEPDCETVTYTTTNQATESGDYVCVNDSDGNYWQMYINSIGDSGYDFTYTKVNAYNTSGDHLLDINYDVYEGNWTASCWASDTVLNSTKTNTTGLYKDFTAPSIFIDSPLEQSYNTLNLSLNYSVVETFDYSCKYNVNYLNGTSVIANTTLDSCANTTVDLTFENESYQLTVFANDTNGNENSTYVNFTININRPSVVLDDPDDDAWSNNGTDIVFNFTVLSSVEATEEASGWWDTNYTYRQVININNSGSDEMHEYFTYNISLDTATLISEGKMMANCSDLRIANSSAEVDRLFFNDTEIGWEFIGDGCNSATSQILFRVDYEIASGTVDTNYSVYYGNSSASAPPDNITKIFIFADDFDRSDATELGNGWQMSGANSFNLSEKTAVLKGANNWATKNLSVGQIENFDGFILYTRVSNTIGDGASTQLRTGNSSYESDKFNMRFGAEKFWIWIYNTTDPASDDAFKKGTLHAPLGQFYNVTWKGYKNTSGEWDMWVTVNATKFEWNHTNITTQENETLARLGMAGNREGDRWDHIYLRRWAETPPTLTTDEESIQSTETQPIHNCSLYGNLSSGTFALNQTIHNVSNGTMTNFTAISLSENIYIWNVKCIDNNNTVGWGFTNYTFGVDLNAPTFEISETTTTQGSQTFSFELNITERYPKECKYTIYNSSGSVDGLNENISFTCSSGASPTATDYGTFNLTIYMEDFGGWSALNSTNVILEQSSTSSTSGGGGTPPENVSLELTPATASRLIIVWPFKDYTFSIPIKQNSNLQLDSCSYTSPNFMCELFIDKYGVTTRYNINMNNISNKLFFIEQDELSAVSLGGQKVIEDSKVTVINLHWYIPLPFIKYSIGQQKKNIFVFYDINGNFKGIKAWILLVLAVSLYIFIRLRRRKKRKRRRKARKLRQQRDSKILKAVEKELNLDVYVK